MPSKLSAATFLKAVRQSGLVGDDQLQALERGWSEASRARDAEAWANKLVEQELLTEWQAGKLLQGKHRGFILGNYRLLALLGKGGMSSVYLAEHRLMRRRCAIKVLPTKHVNSASYLGRFHREAQAVASLDHPNIVRAYDVSHQKEDDAEIHFLVMEYVAGQSLYELVASCGPLAVEDVADFLRQAADGLEHAHRAGIIHRDVKPGNLLVDGSGTVKILDLGLARFFHESFDDRLTLEHDERILGTADFLAPEQALDSHTADHRADVYSLGCTGYFLLTGHPPFTEGTLTQRLMAHQHKTPPPLREERPDLPESLVEIIERMMAKHPAERYQTSGEVSEVLAAWLAEHASSEWKGRYREPRAAAGGTTEEPSSFLQRRKVGNSQPTLVLSNSDTDPAREPFSTLEFDTDLPTIVVDEGPGSGVGSGSATPLPRRPSRAPRRRTAAMLATAGVVVAGLALVIAGWNRDANPDPVPRNGRNGAFEIAEGGRPGADGSATASGMIAPLKWRISVAAGGDFPTLDSALAYVREHRERFDTEGARGQRIHVEVAPGSKVRQAIVVDNSSKRNYPDGLQIVCSRGPAAALEPVGTAPALLVANVSDFLLDGFQIRGDRVETAVHLKGALSGCRLRRLVVEGFTKNGIRCEAVSGVLRSELVLQEVECRSDRDGVNAFAFDGGESGTARVRIQQCRAIGEGGTALRFHGDASYVSILQNIFSGFEEGIRFDGDTITLRHLVIGNNTFHRLEGGIVFSSLPSGSSNELGFYRNLFAEVSGPELRIARDYDLNAFVRMLSTIGRGIRRNWSDRALADGLANGEHDLVIPPDGARVDDFEFESSDPADAGFLKPTPSSRFVIADPQEISQELRPFIGAVAP